MIVMQSEKTGFRYRKLIFMRDIHAKNEPMPVCPALKQRQALSVDCYYEATGARAGPLGYYDYIRAVILSYSIKKSTMLDVVINIGLGLYY